MAQRTKTNLPEPTGPGAAPTANVLVDRQDGDGARRGAKSVGDGGEQKIEDVSLGHLHRGDHPDHEPIGRHAGSARPAIAPAAGAAYAESPARDSASAAENNSHGSALGAAPTRDTNSSAGISAHDLDGAQAGHSSGFASIYQNAAQALASLARGAAAGVSALLQRVLESEIRESASHKTPAERPTEDTGDTSQTPSAPPSDLLPTPPSNSDRPTAPDIPPGFPGEQVDVPVIPAPIDAAPVLPTDSLPIIEQPSHGGDVTTPVETAPETPVDGIETPIVVPPDEDHSAPSTLPVVEAPSLATPTLSVSLATGLENTAIPLSITAIDSDLAGSATLMVTIAGLPANATLSAGSANGDGTWTLSGEQLAGLTLTPGPDSSDDFTLVVTATLYDPLTGATASATAELPVDIVVSPAGETPAVGLPALSAPMLEVSTAVGAENAVIPLTISVGLLDPAASQELTITISGLPTGASLSAGVVNTDGSWTLTSSDLVGLSLSPSPDSGADFTLAVTASVRNLVTGDEAHVSATLPVEVIEAIGTPVEAPTLQAPALAISAAMGAENGTVPLSITASLPDISSGASLTVTIDGLPVGATLSAGVQNADGTWTLIGDELTGLTLSPAPDSDEDFTLIVTATVRDGVTGLEARSEAQLPVEIVDTSPVTVLPILAAPSLSVVATAGPENGVNPLLITAGIADVSGAIDLTVAISGLPIGAMLSAGAHSTDGTWLLTSDQLAGLTLIPASDSGEDFTLTVVATARDALTSIETRASAELAVDVFDIEAPALEIPAIVAPSLSLSAAVGMENGAIPLTISTGLPETGGASLIVIVSGLPEGATLSAGVANTDGSWSLSGDELSGLTLIPAPDSDEDFTLSVTATAHDAITGEEASVTATLPVEVFETSIPIETQTPSVEIPPIMAPTLSVSTVIGLENETVPLTISAALGDGGANDSLSVAVSGLPIGAVLSAGTQNADGTWLLDAGDLAGLTLTPAPDSNVDFRLIVAATVRDTLTGAQASTQVTLPVEIIDAVATPLGPVTGIELPPITAPTLSVSAAAGLENGTIPLAITLGAVDGGAELEVIIAGLPVGAALSAGVANADGSWTVASDDLAGLTLTPAPDSGEDFALSVSATIRDATTGMEATTTAILPVEVIDDITPVYPAPLVVAPIAPSLSASAATGLENGVIPLSITAGLVDTATASTLMITISGMPEGATLSAGAPSGDGGWVLTGDELVGLNLIPAADSDEDFTLHVTATVRDTVTGIEATTSTTLAVEVLEAAPSAELPVVAPSQVEAPTLSISAAAGLENEVIPLMIAASAAELGSPSSLTIAISGLPEGATLSAGVQISVGTWLLDGSELAGLTLTPAADSGEDFTLTVTATVSDGLTGAQASTTATLPVEVIDAAMPLSDAPDSQPLPLAVPTLSVFVAVGAENDTIPLAISIGEVEAATGTLEITVSGLPVGATLSAGTPNADGSWSLASDNLVGLKLTPAPDSGEDFALTVTATLRDAITGTQTSATATLPVEVIDVAALHEIAPDLGVPALAPTLSVSSAIGAAGSEIPLFIALGPIAESTGAHLSVLIAGVPEGATLSAGIEAPDGTWLLSGDELAGLTFTTESASTADFTLTVTATLSDSVTGVETSCVASLPVEIVDMAPQPVELPPLIAPSLSVSAGIGVENEALPIIITASSPDAIDPGVLTITIAGLPDTATLSAGRANTDGTWTLTAGDLSGLTLTPGSDADFTLTVTATVRDALTGLEASNSTTLAVDVSDNPAVPDTTMTLENPILNEGIALDTSLQAGADATDSTGIVDAAAVVDTSTSSGETEVTALSPSVEASDSGEISEGGSLPVAETTIEAVVAPLDTTAATDSLDVDMSDAEFLQAIESLNGADSSLAAIQDAALTTSDALTTDMTTPAESDLALVAEDIWGAETNTTTTEPTVADEPVVPPPAETLVSVASLHPGL